MMTDLVIRPAKPSDAATLMELASRMANFEIPSWRTAAEITEADGRAMVNAVGAGDRDSQVFIAERHGAPDGCLHMVVGRDFFGRQHAHISVVAVTGAAEGTGLGRALMRYAEQWARGRRLRVITLNVFAGNTRARRLYEGAGYGVEVLKYAKAVEPNDG